MYTTDCQLINETIKRAERGTREGGQQFNLIGAIFYFLFFIFFFFFFLLLLLLLLRLWFPLVSQNKKSTKDFFSPSQLYNLPFSVHSSIDGTVIVASARARAHLEYYKMILYVVT